MNNIKPALLEWRLGGKPTNRCSGSDEVSLDAWFALASTVDGRHSESVFQALDQAGTGVLSGADNSVIGLHPQQAVPFLTLYIVTCDGTSAVTLRLIPGYEHTVLVGLVDAAVKGLTRNIW